MGAVSIRVSVMVSGVRPWWTTLASWSLGREGRALGASEVAGKEWAGVCSVVVPGDVGGSECEVFAC